MMATVQDAGFDRRRGTYRFSVDYDESLGSKLSPKPDHLDYIRSLEEITDALYPDERSGQRLVEGRVFRPSRKRARDGMTLEGVRTWIESEGWRVARPKELVDFSRAFPPPALLFELPLAALGQVLPAERSQKTFLFLNLFVSRVEALAWRTRFLQSTGALGRWLYRRGKRDAPRGLVTQTLLHFEAGWRFLAVRDLAAH